MCQLLACVRYCIKAAQSHCRLQCRWTALGLGMILSLLSALPIYKVCRLYECAHPGPSAVAAVA